MRESHAECVRVNRSAGVGYRVGQGRGTCRGGMRWETGIVTARSLGSTGSYTGLQQLSSAQLYVQSESACYCRWTLQLHYLAMAGHRLAVSHALPHPVTVAMASHHSNLVQWRKYGSRRPTDSAAAASTHALRAVAHLYHSYHVPGPGHRHK